jgi:hypothetical protein
MSSLVDGHPEAKLFFYIEKMKADEHYPETYVNNLYVSLDGVEPPMTSGMVRKFSIDLTEAAITDMIRNYPMDKVNIYATKECPSEVVGKIQFLIETIVSLDEGIVS